MSKIDNLIFTSLAKSLNLQTMDLNEESGMLVTKNWDSLNQMNIIFDLERNFSLQIDVTDFEKLTTFRGIKEILLSKGVENT